MPTKLQQYAKIFVLVIRNISFSADRSWDTTVHIATSYGLDSPGFKSQPRQEVSLFKNCPECLVSPQPSTWRATMVLSWR